MLEYFVAFFVVGTSTNNEVMRYVQFTLYGRIAWNFVYLKKNLARGLLW